MEPREFVSKWGITRDELASLTSKSLPTVNRWFADEAKRDPGAEVLTLLASIDALWTARASLDGLPSHIWAVYTLAMARKRISN